MEPESLLIDATSLHQQILEQSVLVFDCRFDLAHPDSGRNSWRAAHIPGAVYAHLDHDLAGRVTKTSGRHPLPPDKSFAEFLARSGWTRDKPVVAYDSQGGMFASRLWWLMNYFGLGRTRILDGGLAAWMAASLPLESGTVEPGTGEIPRLVPDPDMVVTSEDLAARLGDDDLVILDARARSRFEGLEEPIDTVAGHIPGALNQPCSENIADGSGFKPGPLLKQQFNKILGKRDQADVIHMCGSGVTACHNLFAMALAGMPGSRLYVGSWSEWIRDPSRPVVKGSRG